jgi:hypothetical protein
MSLDEIELTLTQEVKSSPVRRWAILFESNGLGMVGCASPEGRARECYPAEEPYAIDSQTYGLQPATKSPVAVVRHAVDLVRLGSLSLMEDRRWWFQLGSSVFVVFAERLANHNLNWTLAMVQEACNMTDFTKAAEPGVCTCRPGSSMDGEIQGVCTPCPVNTYQVSVFNRQHVCCSHLFSLFDLPSLALN